MATQESHAIRNGIIASVVGGALLSLLLDPVRTTLAAAAGWIASACIWVVSALQSDYSIPGWLLGSMIFLSLLSVVQLTRFLLSLRTKRPEDLYREDHLFGVVWRWSWLHGEPTALWCFCPDCDTELVYQEHVQGDGLMRRDTRPDHTLLICERCGVERSKLNGLKHYAMGTVQREIRRKLRSGEWDQPAGRDAA